MRDAFEGLKDGLGAPAAVSEELAALGPYFAVEFHGGPAGDVLPGPTQDSEPKTQPQERDAPAPAPTPESEPPAPPWRSMRELVDIPGVFAERVVGVRAFLAAGTGQDPAAVELRVAASVVHLGLVARVVSPLLALRVLYQRCGVFQASDLWWQPALGSLFPLSLRATALDSPAGFGESVFSEGVISEFAAAAATFGVNDHILRGNTASALAGAGRTFAAARPDRRDDVRALISDLLAGPYLSGSGAFEPDGAFRRRSCCLIYRAAPDHRGGLCGDCVLAATRGPMEP